MKFKITRASDWKDLGVKEFHSLNELQAYAKINESELIINFNEMIIIIYDDYVE